METALTSKQGGPERAGWVACALGLAGLVAVSAGLSGCVTTSTTKEVSADVRTESDQTDADRRARVRMELAAAYFGRGQFTTALDEVKLALQAKPQFADAYNLRGLIYAGMGEPGLAEDSFRHALQLAPRDADTMHNYGWFLCQNRRFADATAQFNAALVVPNYRDVTRTLLAMGVCQARDNQWAEAEKTLLRSYELDPANPVTALNLAEVLMRRGEYERARFYVRRVNSIDEQISPKTLWMAARIENKLGQAGQVQVFGNQLVNRFPQSPEALLYEKGRFDD
jgi:type IV pilus assembly protein PilF